MTTELTPEQQAKLDDYPLMLRVVHAAHYVLENYMPEDDQGALEPGDPILELDQSVKALTKHVRAARKRLGLKS